MKIFKLKTSKISYLSIFLSVVLHVSYVSFVKQASGCLMVCIDHKLHLTTISKIV